MKQETGRVVRIADDARISEGVATGVLKTSGHSRRGAGSKEAALISIREMLAEVAVDAAYIGIHECVPLIAAADLALDNALTNIGRSKARRRGTRA